MSDINLNVDMTPPKGSEWWREPLRFLLFLVVFGLVSLGVLAFAIGVFAMWNSGPSWIGVALVVVPGLPLLGFMIWAAPRVAKAVRDFKWPRLETEDGHPMSLRDIVSGGVVYVLVFGFVAGCLWLLDWARSVNWGDVFSAGVALVFRAFDVAWSHVLYIVGAMVALWVVNAYVAVLGEQRERHEQQRRADLAEILRKLHSLEKSITDQKTGTP